MIVSRTVTSLRSDGSHPRGFLSSTTRSAQPPSSMVPMPSSRFCPAESTVTALSASMIPILSPSPRTSPPSVLLFTAQKTASIGHGSRTGSS